MQARSQPPPNGHPTLREDAFARRLRGTAKRFPASPCQIAQSSCQVVLAHDIAPCPLGGGCEQA
eukprot:15468587-Alexandrium_andersonii.AAC.1